MDPDFARSMFDDEAEIRVALHSVLKLSALLAAAVDEGYYARNLHSAADDILKPGPDEDQKRRMRREVLKMIVVLRGWDASH